MKKYQKYKVSGVEWIGQIPEGWEIKKTKYISQNFDGKRVPLSSEQRGEMEKKYPYWGSNGIIDFVEDFIFDGEYVLVGEDGSPFFDRFKEVAFYISEKSWINNHIHILKAKEVHSKFLVYSFNCVDFRDYISGSTRDKLNQSSLDVIMHPIPSLKEQSQIVSFLDQKTSIIDDLILKKLQKIELLKEQRASIINKAVTKGLNPDATMRDSSVEWIGEIPEHWKKTKLKSKFKSTGGGTPSKEISEYWNGDIPWVSPKDMKSKYIDNSEDRITQIGLNNSATNLIEEPSLLIVVRSGILQRTIPLGINTVPVTINQDMKSLQPVSGDSIDFLYYFIKGNEENLLMEWSKVGATVESIEMEFMNNAKIPFPPIPEQHQIVAYLDKKASEIDKQIIFENRKIDLLKEYRQSLISEVVTGKIDVRTN